jgi:mannosyltransferase
VAGSLPGIGGCESLPWLPVSATRSQQLEAGVPAEPAASARVAATVLSIGCVGAVVLGAALRFVARTPLWLDEALSVHVAALPVGLIGDALSRDGHPPLYYLLLHGWMELFGEGDRAVRALSGVFGLAQLVVTVPLVRRLTGRIGFDQVETRRAVMVSLAVTAVTPYVVRYSTETRMYSLVMMLVTGGWWLTLRLADQPGWGRAVPVAVCAGCLLWTQYWSMYLLAAVGIGALWFAIRHRRRGAQWLLGALVAGGISFVPWLPTLLDQLASTGTPWSAPARPTVTASIALVDLGGFSADAAAFGFVLAVAAVLGVVGHRGESGALELTWGRERGLHLDAAVAATTVGLGAAATFVGRSGFASRYTAVVVPFVLVFAGVGLARLRRWAPVSGLVLVGVLAVPGLLYNARTDRTQAGDIAAAVVADRTSLGVPAGATAIVVCPDQLGPAVVRALGQLDAPIVVATNPILVEPYDAVDAASAARSANVVSYPAAAGAALVDWRDYEERNRAASPTLVLENVASSPVVYVVSRGGYRTLEGKCEALLAALGGLRPAVSLVTARAGVFEPMDVTRFGPVGEP